MKMVKSLFLGSAAGLVAVAGAQAADLPVKAKPVQYVKICSLYGAGFYYIPGTDTCIKLGGFVRAEENFNSNGSYAQYTSNGASHAQINWDNKNQSRYYERVRGLISVDARSQTQYGTLRAYVDMSTQDNNSNAIGGGPYFGANTTAPTAAWANNAFIQFAGFTFGKTTSFFDFDTTPYSNQTNQWGSTQAGNGIPVWAYTAQFGNGVSASISAEDNYARQSSISNPFQATAAPATNGYSAKGWPDIVGNLRVDQAWGSAQVMAAVHDVNAFYTFPAGTRFNDTGWAAGAGVKINFPMVGAGDYFIAQVGYTEGALNYILSGNLGIGGNAYYNIGNNSSTGFASAYDAVIVGGTSMHLTTGWSVVGGYEHRWNPNWKTSLYGAYGAVKYDDAANVQLGGVLNIGENNWSHWQVGSRTVWTPVENFDLSVDVMYQHLNTAFGTGGYIFNGVPVTDQSWWSGMFRVQRNFWP